MREGVSNGEGDRERMKDIDICFRMLPAKYVGGDIYDIVKLDEDR